MATTPFTASAHVACEKNTRTPPASRQPTLGLASSTDNLESRSALAPRTNRAAALATPVRKGAAAARGHGPHAALTPREAAISARKQAEEQKKREGMLLRRQREEVKNNAKAKQAAMLAHQHEMIRKRAEMAQRQRKDAAAAKKAARERETAAKANELQTKMRENQELQECISKQAREKRRNSVAYKNAAWSRERALKKKLHEARQQEDQMIMDGRNVFIEAKQRVREQREQAEKKERVWRARTKKHENTLRQRQGALTAHEARRARRDRALDQAALEKKAAEEKRLRRGSAQWRRNEKILEVEIKRGSAEEALDAKRLADEVCLREEDRKARARERELADARKADEEYRRLEHLRGRLYREEEEMRKKEQEARERRIMLEDRTSVLESRGKEEEAELDRREALREVPSEKTKLEILEAIWSRQSHPAATAAARGRRRLRLEKVEELTSLRVTVSPEAQTSGESGGAGRISSENNGGCGVGGGGDFYREYDGIMSDSGSSCSSGSSDSCGSSGMGIPGRVSVCSSLGSLTLKCRERPSWGVDDALMSRTSQSATGLGGTAGVSAAASRPDSNAIEARGVTDEAAAVLAAAEQSFNSVESLDEAGAAAMASAAAADWPPSGGPSHYHNESDYFPVRALVFPQTPTEEEAPREEAQAEEEAERGLRGSAVDRSEAYCGERDVGVIPSGKDDSTVTTVEDSERDEFRAGGKGSVGGEADDDVLSSMNGKG